MAQNQEHDFQTCLTPEDVKRPKEDSSPARTINAATTISPWAAARSTPRCTAAGKDGDSQMMPMAGTYSPDSYRLQTSMNMQGGREGGMAMTMRSRRIASANAQRGQDGS